MIEVAKTLKSHIENIFTYLHIPSANAAAEWLNSKVQLIMHVMHRALLVTAQAILSTLLNATSAGTVPGNETRKFSALAVLHDGPTCRNWRSIAGLRLSGRYVMSGLTLGFRMTIDARSGRFAQHYAGAPNLPAGGTGFDGRSAWSANGAAAHPLNSRYERGLARSRAWLARRGWCSSDYAGATVTPLRVNDASGDFAVVRAVPPFGAPIEMWIDRSTGLLDRTLLQLAETREIDRFADWRTVAGVVVPFGQRVDYPEDTARETWIVTAARALRALPAVAFAQPAPAADATIDGGATSTTVPYRIEGQKPLVDVWLDGRGPFPFVVDTGGHFILTPATARRIGARTAGAEKNLGQGTEVRTGGFAHVATLRIGAALIRDQVAAVVPYSFARLERGPRPPKAGWLGLQFFERFAVTFNPRTHRMTIAMFAHAPAAPRAVRVPLLFDEDAPVVACRIAGRPGTCMIDTGNAGPTIVEGHWLERVGLTDRLRHGLDEDGDRIARTRIDIGPLALRDELVDYSPPAVRGSESTYSVAAILAEDLTGRYGMTVNYRDGWLALQPLGIAAAPYDRTGLRLEKQTDGTFVVAAVAADSPAAQAGVNVGDRIVAVDGVLAQRFSRADLSTLGRGPVGSIRRYDVMRRHTRLRIAVRLRDRV